MPLSRDGDGVSTAQSGSSTTEEFLLATLSQRTVDSTVLCGVGHCYLSNQAQESPISFSPSKWKGKGRERARGKDWVVCWAPERFTAVSNVTRLQNEISERCVLPNAFLCSSKHRRCISKRTPRSSCDELIVNIFLVYLGSSKMERLNRTSCICIFNVCVGFRVGCASFLDAPAVHLPCPNLYSLMIAMSDNLWKDNLQVLKVHM